MSQPTITDVGALVADACEECLGDGTRAGKRCHWCAGSGSRRVSEAIRIAEALAVLDGWCESGGEKLRHYRLANEDSSVEMSPVELYETDGTAAGEKLVEYFDEPTRLASLQAAAQWVREQGGGK